MKEMTKQQKQILLVAGGALVLYLLYRWYQGQRQPTTQSTAAPNTAATDYAALAGQEQSDVAALQGQNQDLLGQLKDLVGTVSGNAGQEQSDVAGLQATLGGNAAQEGADISGLTASIAGLTSAEQADIQGLGQQIAALGTGTAPANRTANATVTTHRGGPFYNYYVRVTGHPPSGRIQASNFVYQAWKAGVSATALQKPKGANHAGAKNKTVAHPNPGHRPRPPMHNTGPRSGGSPPSGRTQPSGTPRHGTPGHGPPPPHRRYRRHR